MSAAAQWLGLALLSLALGAACFALRLPAALLLGSMLAGIAFGANGSTLRLRGEVGAVVLGVIGCLIAARITPTVIGQFTQHGFLLVAVALSSLFASTVLGLVLTRVRELPGTTAI